MKDRFKSFYQEPRSDQDWAELLRTATISFDASTLLDLFEFQEQSVNEWFDALGTVRNRLWLTHQAALEYHLNAHGISKKVHNSKEKVLAQFKLAASESFEQLCKALDPTASSQLTQALAHFTEAGKQNSTKAEAVMSEWTNDYKARCKTIRNRLADLFDQKVGPAFTRNEFVECSNAAAYRYAQKIPPGFADANKANHDGNQYGDAFVWFQLLNYAKAQQDPEKPVVLVTSESSDRKRDWFESGRPRPELAFEMESVAGIEFGLLNSKDFVRRIKDKVNPSTLADMDAVAARKASEKSEEVNRRQLTILEAMASGEVAFQPITTPWSPPSSTWSSIQYFAPVITTKPRATRFMRTVAADLEAGRTVKLSDSAEEHADKESNDKDG